MWTGGNNEFSFGHNEFEVPGRHSSVGVVVENVGLSWTLI